MSDKTARTLEKALNVALILGLTYLVVTKPLTSWTKRG